MKAIRVHAPGGADALHHEDIPEPSPGPSEALVEVEAAGINFIDVYVRSGLYRAPLPLTLGREGAGHVIDVGEDVTEFRAGDRVVWEGVPGAYAQRAVVPANRLVRLPDALSARDGAAVMLQGMTAHYLACSAGPLERGDTCLVHAAAGGVGLLLVQIAKMRGATVIGTTGTHEKAELARSVGADHIIVYTEQDFEAETKRITYGEGVRVVYDSVGRSTFDSSLRCLARLGTLVLYGQSSGPVPPIDPQRLNAGGSLFLTRPTLAHYTFTRDALLARANDVLEWVQSGRLVPHIGGEFPLARAGVAHQLLESRSTTGKLILLP
ncbi:MAG: quinone oxidoreductase family protein [Longimicrobiales bacterium]